MFPGESMWLANAVLSALANVVVLAGIPFLIYWIYQRRGRQRSFDETRWRAGLQLGELRYVGYSLVVAAAASAALVIWPPPVEALAREGSATRAFVGLGLGTKAVVLALLYGVVKTGFTEELLFRGMIAGSLFQRLDAHWANLSQAVIFLLPHLPLLWIMPEMWPLLPIVFVSALVVGWLRNASESIVGPWLIHASANVTTCLSIAART